MLFRSEQLPGCMKPVRRKSLDTHHRVCARRVGRDVMAQPDVGIPKRRNGARIERLNFDILDRLAKGAFALSLDLKAIDIAAEPGIAFPAIAITARACLKFSQIEQDH